MLQKYLKTNQISRIVIFSSLSIVLRVLFGPFPNIKPLTAIFLVCLNYFSLIEGIMIMGITMIVSGMLFGANLVIFWQIISFCLIQLIWYLFLQPFFIVKHTSVLFQSLCAGLLAFVYGFIISIMSAIQLGLHPIIFWITGFSFDFLHAISTFLFYPIILKIIGDYYEKN
ncbi:TPA: hypothetical protein U2D39_001687 [Streptococcus suis]|nr:hypothetical protein [Streptococcus suis]